MQFAELFVLHICNSDRKSKSSGCSRWTLRGFFNCLNFYYFGEQILIKTLAFDGSEKVIKSHESYDFHVKSMRKRQSLYLMNSGSDSFECMQPKYAEVGHRLQVGCLVGKWPTLLQHSWWAGGHVGIGQHFSNTPGEQVDIWVTLLQVDIWVAALLHVVNHQPHDEASNKHLQWLPDKHLQWLPEKSNTLFHNIG